MKKIIATSLLTAALAVVPAVQAENVECPTSQYGNAECGVEYTTQTTTVVHTVPAGIDDLSLAQIIALTGIVAVAASVLYKLTYKTYILG